MVDCRLNKSHPPSTAVPIQSHEEFGPKRISSSNVWTYRSSLLNWINAFDSKFYPIYVVFSPMGEKLDWLLSDLTLFFSLVLLPWAGRRIGEVAAEDEWVTPIRRDRRLIDIAQKVRQTENQGPWSEDKIIQCPCLLSVMLGLSQIIWICEWIVLRASVDFIVYIFQDRPLTYLCLSSICRLRDSEVCNLSPRSNSLGRLLSFVICCL